MKEFLALASKTLKKGIWKKNRTGIPTVGILGEILRFDLQEGHPAITTRKLAFKMGVGELIGFLRASRSAADFRALGCKVWDQNANENEQWLKNPYRSGHDDLGPIYGVQWRKWPAYKEIAASNQAQLEDALSKGFVEIARREVSGEVVIILFKEIDQIRQCVDTIINNPDDRRILFHGWNPAKLDEIALPTCHFSYQFHADSTLKELSLTLVIRSSDIGLGLPTNANTAACLLALVARLTGYKPRILNIMISDAHIYENTVPMIEEQLKREPFARPRLVISDRIPEFAKTGIYEPEWLDKIEPSDFTLDGYEHHAPLTAPMAV